MIAPRPWIRALAASAASLAAAACAREAATEAEHRQGPAPGAGPAAAPAPADHSAFVAAVDRLAQEALESGPVAGLSVAVYARGAFVLAKGYGSADLESGVPATAQTSYPIASVSKYVTAALVLRLADQGRLGLDDPLSGFFPQARPQIGALTLRHLLDHTSGLTRGGPSPRAAARSVLRRGGTARDQGEVWDYSNYNFSLLGLVIEQVTGRDYADYVHDELAVRLGLTGTGYCEDGTDVPGRGRDYLSGKRAMSRTPYWTEPRFFAAGGLCSTVRDLVSWEQALEQGRVVSPALLAAMRSPARLPGGIEAGYGLGTRLGLTSGRPKLGHTGGGQSNKAVLARYPDDDVSIAVLLNTERPHASVTATDLEERIARLWFAPAGTPEAAGPLAPGRYEGQYREGSRLASVTAGEGTLVLRPGLGRRAESRLVAAPGGAFVDVDDPSLEVRFQVRDDEARAFARYRNGWFVGMAVREERVPGRATKNS